MSSQRVISAMIWDFLGKGGLTLARFAESIVLVRLLGSSDYGILAVLFNFQGTIVLLTSLGIEGALSRFIPELQVKEKTSTIPELIRQTGIIRSVLLLLVSGLCFFFAAPLIQLIFEDSTNTPQQLENYLRLATFLIFSVGMQDLIRRILVIHYRQRLINTVEFFTFCAYLTGAVVSIQSGWGITGVLLSYLASKLTILLIFLVYSRTYFIRIKTGSSASFSLRKRFYPYAISFYFYALMLHVLGKGGDIFILGAFLPNINQVAFYTIAFNFAFFSTSFFELALQGGFVLPFVSEIYQKGNQEVVHKVYNGLFEFIYLFTIPISVGGILMADELISVFYGPSNAEAASLLVLFFVHFSIVKIGILNSSFMLAADQQNRLIASRIFFGGFNMVLNMLLVLPFQALGVVWGTLITGVLASMYETWCVHQLIHPRYSWRFLRKIAFASCGMGGIVWLLGFLPIFSLPLKMILLIGTGGLSYTILLIVLKPVSPDNLTALQDSNLPFKRVLFRLLARKA
ncbi:MAG: oligosaccharide flippase family protein [SAR324 cluster bacterium]|nr:oligosaccharide flippase family protein [SAR324 cluster bacterium]